MNQETTPEASFAEPPTSEEMQEVLARLTASDENAPEIPTFLATEEEIPLTAPEKAHSEDTETTRNISALIKALAAASMEDDASESPTHYSDGETVETSLTETTTEIVLTENLSIEPTTDSETAQNIVSEVELREAANLPIEDSTATNEFVIADEESSEITEIAEESVIEDKPEEEITEETLIRDEAEVEIFTDELQKPRWAVISAEDCAAVSLTYHEAIILLKQLEEYEVSGLCIVTNESAGRMLQNLIKNF